MEHPLRQWRDRNEIRLEALAEQVGVKASHLSMIERGLRRPSFSLAEKISEVTHGEVPVSAFAGKKIAA